MKNAIKSLLNGIRFYLSASNNFLFMWYYRNFYKPKKGSLSSFLSDYSKKIGKGFTVIQIGANDGITHDPIHKFIKRDRWKGVLLEPQRYVFDKYLSKIYRKHDNITVLNAALGYEDSKAPIYKIGFSNARWATGLTTFDKKTLQKAFDSGHVARKCKKEGIEIPKNKEEHIIEEKVDVVSKDTLVGIYGINDIDLLMIDTEGFDFEVIKMFDIPSTKPGAIIFEHSHLSESDYTDCEKLLQDNGYDIKKDGANTVAVSKEINDFGNYFSS